MVQLYFAESYDSLMWFLDLRWLDLVDNSSRIPVITAEYFLIQSVLQVRRDRFRNGASVSGHTHLGKLLVKGEVN